MTNQDLNLYLVELKTKYVTTALPAQWFTPESGLTHLLYLS